MVVDSPLTDDDIDRIFRALADRTRRDILRRSMADRASVSSLASAYEMSFAAVQKHVAMLEKAGLVEKESRGRQRLVRANPDRLSEAQALLEHYQQAWVDRMDRLESLLAAESTDTITPTHERNAR